MRTFLNFVSLLVLSISLLNAKPTAFLNYCNFYNPGQGNQFEAFVTVDINSVKIVSTPDNKFTAKVLLEWKILEQQKIVFYDKYLLTAEPQAEKQQLSAFMDKVSVMLPNGLYSLQVTATDANDDSSTATAQFNFELKMDAQQISASQILLIDKSITIKNNKYLRNGKLMYPLVSNVFPNDSDEVNFYAEFYNATADVVGSEMLLKYALYSSDKSNVIGQLVANKKVQAEKIIAIEGSLPLQSVPTGNYTLSIELRDRTNNLLAATELLIERTLPNYNAGNIIDLEQLHDMDSFTVATTFAASITGLDSLLHSVNCLYPISGNFDRQFALNVLESRREDYLQKYLYYFWNKRSPNREEAAWRAYSDSVRYADSQWGSHYKRGYESDRGRVYLQYGAPNDMAADRTGTKCYPYEIWHYYKLKNQSNRRFLFYSSENISNDYVLLHSDAIGELQEPNWDIVLHERNQSFGNDWDNRNANRYVGKRTLEDFATPH